MGLAIGFRTAATATRLKCFARPQHRRQRLGIGQSVIVADFDQGGSRLPSQLLALGKRDRLVGSTVQDDRVLLHGRRLAPSLPSGAQQNEPGINALDIHRNGTASA